MSSSKPLLAIVDKFSGARICVAGDLILDHYVWGSVDRISPEAPVVVVNVTRESHSLGGAANVANNLTSLGAAVSIYGAVSNDEHGAQLRRLLEAQGIDVEGVITIEDRPTTRKSRVIASVQQVVRIDRESSALLVPDADRELCSRLQHGVEDCSAVVISDYAKGVVSPGLCAMLGAESKAGRFGLNKRPLIIDPKERNFKHYRGATVVKPNRKEAVAASGIEISTQEDARAAARRLAEMWDSEMVLITLGAKGMVLEPREQHGAGFALETEAREVFDVSGAGDTVSAVFSLALAVGATPREAAQLANYAAGIVVATVGAVAVPLDQLREVICRQ